MPSEALAKEGRSVRYVYLLESESFKGQRYVGLTSDLKGRLLAHNGKQSPHTSKYAPWKLVTYVAFSDDRKAESFERYLKSGSGHAFARKRLL
jgi:putative endonuclease